MKRSLLSLAIIASISFTGIADNAALPARVLAQKPKVISRILPAPNPLIEDEAEFYNKTLILSEDFSKFTAGSFDAPEAIEEGWVNPELTSAPYWSSVGLSQADGCAYIDMKASALACLCTPVLEIPQNGKPLVVTFRAYLADKEYNFDWAQVYVVDCSDPDNPRTFDNEYAYDYQEWGEYKFVFDKERKSTSYFFQFSGYDASIYFDDIEIKFLDPKVEAPVATDFDNFSSNGFTAHWEPVAGADSYTLDLFTIAYDRNKTRTYVAKDLKASGTSYTFSDFDTSGATYYYTVRAVKGADKSPESNPVKVNGLDTPGEVKFELTDHNTIKLSWDAVPGTQYYEVLADRTYEATSDMTYVISDENFDDLVSTGTYTAPEELTSAYEELDEILYQPGWIAENPVHISGAYGLVGYYYQHYGELAYLESPICDFSANGGKVSVSVDLYGQPIDLLDECKAVIRLLQYVSEEETKVLSSKTTDELPAEWTNVQVDLSNGAPNTVVEICSKAGYLYINNILITQDLKAGEKISVPYTSLKTEKNEVELPIQSYLCGGNVSVKLRAVKELWDSEHFSVDEYVRSSYSKDYTYSVPSAGVDAAEAAAVQPKVFVRNGELVVVNPNADSIAVYDSLGRLVASDSSCNNLVTLPVDAKGVLIVTVGATTLKAVK
ncbi:MAG: fibronectin type III domain-containing protein [Bacteroidales bacterium]|nr:fibronectin type III domain-containing protein [Bacteroidales bacterium]